MRKTAVVLGLAGLGLLMLFAIPQLGAGQIGMFVQDQSVEAERDLELEISILKIINKMELTEEQMTLLRDNIAQIRTGHDGVSQAQLELRDFLVGFNGTRDELAEAVSPFEERVNEAEKMYSEQLFTTLDQFKDVFTMRQGEFLHGHMGYDHDMHGNFQFDFDRSVRIDEEFFDKLESKIEIFEERVEDWGERVGEWGEELGERLSEMFEDFDESDYHHYYQNHGDSGNWRVMADRGVQVYELPDIHVRVNPHEMIGYGMMSGMLMDNLEVWERLLTEKLDRMTPVTQSEDSI